MGLFIITLIALFDPNGLVTAIIIAAPIIIIALAIFYSPQQLLISALILAASRFLIVDMSTDPAISETALYDAVVILGAIAEVITSMLLAGTAMFGYLRNKPIGVPLISMTLRSSNHESK
jgi:hypothetical protein